jgi:hypothetical protein
MSKRLVERLAKKAADHSIKSANFDIMSIISQLLSQGSGMLQGMELKDMMPYMGMAAPLFKGVGSVAGLPGIAGMLDTLRGGQNFQTLTAGGFGQYGQQATSAPQPAGQVAGPGQPAPQSTPAPNNAPIQPNTPKPPIQTPATNTNNSSGNAKVG